MILTIDTSLGKASVAITDGNKILCYEIEQEFSKQAETLFQLIDNCLVKTNLKYIDFTHIVSSIGPGSFTGIRVGMAAAKGICIGLKAQFIGLNTLETICYKHITENECALALIDAGRGQFYSQPFSLKNNELTGVSNPKSVNYNEVILEAENCDKIIANKNNEIFNLLGLKQAIISDINAADYANLANFKLRNQLLDFSIVAPLYLREADAAPAKKFIWN